MKASAAARTKGSRMCRTKNRKTRTTAMATASGQPPILDRDSALRGTRYLPCDRLVGPKLERSGSSFDPEAAGSARPAGSAQVVGGLGQGRRDAPGELPDEPAHRRRLTIGAAPGRSGLQRNGAAQKR